MSDVTVIGLGEMGSSLAKALLRCGNTVTVWNRSPQKAGDLVSMGAAAAGTASEAIRASEIVVVCVSDYPATCEILDGIGGDALVGRVVIQLSTGLPGEARGLATRMTAAGADYLDGAILAWPRQIGIDATILIAGEADTLGRAEATLRALAGNLISMGGDIAAPATLFNAILAYLAGHWIGFAHGAAICESEGMDVSKFGKTLVSLAPLLAQDSQHMANVVVSGRYTEPESTLRTAGTDIGRLVRHAEERSLNPAFVRACAELFAQAFASGFGSEEHVAVIKMLRPRTAAR